MADDHGGRGEGERQPGGEANPLIYVPNINPIYAPTQSVVPTRDNIAATACHDRGRRRFPERG
jgi:hypothetical protein